MKKVLFLLLVTAFTLQAQVVTPLLDSTGTAVSSHWRRVDLGASSGREVEARNLGQANVTLATTATDTGTSRGAYQNVILPKQSISLYTNQRYFYFKSASGSVDYSIGTGKKANLSGTGVFTQTATFTRDSNITTYAADDIFHKSTASLLVFPVGNVNGGTGFLTGVTMGIDSSNITNATFTVWILSDSAAVTLAADNAAHVLDTTKVRFLVGTASLSMTRGSSTSTATVASADNLNFPFKLNSASKNLYAYITTQAAYVPPFVKKVRITLKGVND